MLVEGWADGAKCERCEGRIRGVAALIVMGCALMCLDMELGVFNSCNVPSHSMALTAVHLFFCCRLETRPAGDAMRGALDLFQGRYR